MAIYGIIRSGPFASGSINWRNEPAIPNATFVPVNCAMNRSTRWVWRFYEDYRFYNDADTQIQKEYIDGLPSINKSESLIDGGLRLEHTIRFRYQAHKEFDMIVPYSISSSATSSDSGDTGAFSDIEIEVDNVNEFSDGDYDSGFLGGDTSTSISGTATVTLPRSVVPLLVQIRTRAVAGVAEEGTGSASIQVGAS